MRARPATRETIDEMTCTIGPFFGAMTDAAAYRAIMARAAAPFIAAADRLAGCIAVSGLRSIVGDAAQGYNPVHDVCGLVINSACKTLGVENYELPLVGRPDAAAGAAVEIYLSDALFRKTLAAACREADLAVDMDEALRTVGAEPCRSEFLHRALAAGPSDGLPDETPFYERHGENRVPAGKYSEVLRRREHVLPIAEALCRAR